MYKLIAMYKRPDDPAAFDAHYRDVHRPLVERIPGLSRLVVNRGVDAPWGGESAYYLIAEMHFPDEAVFKAAMASPENASPQLRSAYEAEMQQGISDLARKDLVGAFLHFERAHILGQRSTRLHVRAHIAMLRVGWLRRDRRELIGQVTRIVAAALFSRIWVPEGNTGGANVSALKRMPIAEELKDILTQARAGEPRS